MIITYHGIECCRAQFGDTTIVFNPISKESQFKPARMGADIVLSTTNHPDLNGFDVSANGGRELFRVFGPGEYEINEVIIKGFSSTTSYGGEEKINTVYKITFEKINILFTGPIASIDLSEDIEEALGDIDILFVPIGGDGTLKPFDAYKLSVNVAPHIVIPMHYGKVGEKNALNTFLKEQGYKDLTPQDKLTVKPKDLEQKEGEMVVLSE